MAVSYSGPAFSSRMERGQTELAKQVTRTLLIMEALVNRIVSDPAAGSPTATLLRLLLPLLKKYR